MRLQPFSLLICFSLVGCMGNLNTERFSGKTQTPIILIANQEIQGIAKIEQPFLVEVESNPSTGYRWLIVNRPELIKCVQVLKEQVFPDDIQGGRVGAPGKQQWQLKAKCSGIQRIQFEYRRSWEGPQVMPQSKATLQLSIQNDK